MAYASVGDVEIELGRTASSPAEDMQWTAWLERVERSIARRFVRAGLVLADQVALNDPAAEDVKDAEVSAVVRKITNPTGITSVSRTLDDGTLTTRREGVDDSGLSLTDDEWNDLLPFGESGAFSTQPGFIPDCVAWPSPHYGVVPWT